MKVKRWFPAVLAIICACFVAQGCGDQSIDLNKTNEEHDKKYKVDED